MSYLVKNPEDRFSHDEAQIITQVNCEGSGEPAHLRNLTRSFTVKEFSDTELNINEPAHEIIVLIT